MKTIINKIKEFFKKLLNFKNNSHMRKLKTVITFMIEHYDEISVYLDKLKAELAKENKVEGETKDGEGEDNGNLS